jgi:hypothetical protein
MKLTKDSFIEEFERNGRSENFSIQGLTALYDLLEEFIPEDWEPDIIGLCCGYREDTKKDVLEYLDLTLQELEDKTWVRVLENGNILYAIF